VTTEPFSDDAVRLKVLDLGTNVAAPFAATLLGDLGAEVIKCEQPGLGDPIRKDVSRWLMEGRNKRSITLNLRTPEGQQIIQQLASWADVLIENFRPGTMSSWGIGYEELSAINPRLVYVAISGFGQTGPYAPLSGYDFIGSAFGGLTALNGSPDRPPVIPNLYVVDHTSGLFAALGALEAVRRRDAPGGTGRGSFVDLALYESMLRYTGTDVVEYSRTGTIRPRVGGSPTGEGHHEPPYFYAYKTRDERWMSVVTITPRQIQELRALIADERLHHEKFDTLTSTMGHAVEFYDIVSTWVAAHDFDELWDILTKTTIAASAINTAKDIVENPHVRERGSILDVETEDGTMAMPVATPRLDDGDDGVRWVGESLGASNDHVYAEVLGLSEREIADLRARGVI
jgi:crotonobetainyl-CoA:carnitine CoA-transferase CaiB-like acyl-CoA transferase